MGTRLIAGAMSGTSADGVDVSIVQVSGRGPEMTARLVCHEHQRYPRELRRAILDTRASGAADLAHLARMGREIAVIYAHAVNAAAKAAGVDPGRLDAVAAHGQTLFHRPPDTMQWIDPAVLAGEVGCPVVSDFRRADCAAGGQGAPLVPFADFLLFRHPTKHRVLLNIGGIANLTWLPAGGSADDLLAFDTGPGNCISDWLCRRYEPTGPGYDPGGQLASSGAQVPMLCEVFAREPWLAGPPPKSTDGPEMIHAFERALSGAGAPLGIEQLLATSCLITATTIFAAMGRFLPRPPDELIVSGGGTANRCLMQHLTRLASASGAAVRTTDELGVPSAAKEAIAFALLGAATLDGIPSNIPSCTGARRAVVLGSITPRP